MENQTLSAPPAVNTVQSEPVLNPAAEQAPPAQAPVETAPENQAPVEGADAPLLDPTAQEEKDKGEAELRGAPEKYEAFVVPEGFASDDTSLEAASGVFRELGLSQKGAQKLVDLYAEQFGKIQAAGQEELVTQQKQWRETIRNTPTYREDLGFAKQGMRALLKDDESVKLFTGSWLADHPVMFKLFSNAGRLLGEDTGFGGGGGDGSEKSDNEVRFPINKKGN